MNLPPEPFFVDAHEDLAFHCLEFGRDFVDPGTSPCMITLPWLQQTGVRLVCATFYVAHDKPEAERRYLLNSEYHFYAELFSRYPNELRLVRNQGDLAELATAPGVQVAGRQGYPIGFILLMEGLELLGSPAEMQVWFERGVRMASLTWNGRNRYASGTFADKKGLTPPGRQMLRAMHELGMILDLAHLADAGISEALELYPGPICSTHTNARALCNIERNHTDSHLLQLASRNGVVGLNFLAPLLKQGWKQDEPVPKLAYAIRQVEYLSELLGRDKVGLGTDLDGGLTPANTPEGINRITDLPLLINGLAAAGWSERELQGFRGTNWWRFFEQNLPA